jgi:aryl-alcohol dehydrogenase-like predicted oxidoreductase
MNTLHRRRFLQAAVASVAAAGMGSEILAGQQDSPGGVPTRPLGKTGQQVSIVGLGGYHIGTIDESLAISIMQEAIDGGMRFFDNAWDYNGGRSEEYMGKALATGGRRQKVFLMTKVCARDYAGAKQHLDDSLRRMKTDVIDLWQFHEINWDIDSEWLYERGALRAAEEARRAGKVRFIGFTGHKDPSHLLKMLATPFAWDTVQMPINVLDAHFRSFQKLVLPRCVERKIAVLGMKSLSNSIIPKELKLPAEVCRRFSLSLPISSLMCGIQSRENLRQDLAMAQSFKPLTGQDVDELLAKTALPARDGKLEPHKTTRFGAAYHFRQHEE